MATTTNYGWTTPDDTALVKDGAAAIRTLGSSVDTSVKALSPGTTAGDIDYYASSTAKTRLGIGSTGQVLTVAAGVPSWATAASGGMTLISTTTLTGASVTLSSIPQTYNNLQIVVQNFKPATDNSGLRLRVNSDSGTRYLTLTTTSGFNDSFSDTELTLMQNNDNSVATGLSVTTIPNYANSATWKIMNTQSIAVNGTTTANFNSYTSLGGYYNQTTAISSLLFYPSAGNFTSGTVLLYGVK
jgi:hypothetical protein